MSLRPNVLFNPFGCIKSFSVDTSLIALNVSFLLTSGDVPVAVDEVGSAVVGPPGRLSR